MQMAIQFILFLTLVLFGATEADAKAAAKTKQKSKSPLQADPAWAEKELRRMGLSKAFIAEAIKHYEPASFDATVTLNLLGFLRPAGEHMNRVTPQAIRESTRFVNEYQKFFTKAEKKHKVPAPVISSLLWIETRHGRDMGKFHIVSVYLHLLQADRKKNRVSLTKLAFEKNKTEQRFTKKELRKVMLERTKRKSDWAREQILALATIRKKKHLNIKTLRGSYAGAFGLAQFIPSSYKDYAQALKPQGTPDLTQPGDAIMSVANYLRRSGWKKKGDEENHIEALMKYNNSRDYAESILEISKQVVAARAEVKTRGISSTEEERP